MRRIKILLSVLVAVLLMAAPAFAWDFFVKVGGSTGVEAFLQHGDALTGGYSGGNTGGTYNASDLHHSSGASNSQGEVGGDSSQTPSKSISRSFSTFWTDASALGRFTDISIFGKALQAVFATVKDGEMFANAGNKTWVDFFGTRSGNGFISGSGLGEAVGNSTATLINTPTGVEASASTFGKSFGFVRLVGGCIDPIIGGIGGASSFIYKIGTGLEVSAANSANFQYYLATPLMASGLGNANVNSMISLLPGKIIVDSSAASKSLLGK